MPVTESDIPLLAALAKYYVLTREQLQCVTDREDVSDRSTRKHLNKLLHAGLISKHSAQITLPDAKGSAPVYFPTKDGGRVLASWFDDDRFLVIKTRLPRADRLAHWVALNETRIGIERTLAAQSELKLVEWISEWEVINKDSHEKEHFTLQTVLSEVPPLSCSPDAGMLLSVDGESKVYYLEQDQGTSSAHQVASRKCKGYAELARQAGHLKHFPQATVPNFGIIVVTTDESRCRQLVRELRTTIGHERWLMIAQRDIDHGKFLAADVIHQTDGKRHQLVAPATGIIETTCSVTRTES